MPEVRDNPEKSRFELDAGGHLAVSYYKQAGGVVTFMHTEVPKELEGQGIGSRLVRGALELVRAKKLKVVAKCPFVAAYLKKHSEFDDLRAYGAGTEAEKKHLDALLDEALDESFPASDPIAVDPEPGKH